MRFFWTRLLRRRDFRIIGTLLLVWLLVIVCAPYLSPGDPYAQDLTMRLAPNTAAHPFGTDQLGRDELTRLLYGGRISIALSLVIVAMTAVAGILIGTFAAFLRGFADRIVTALLDLFLSMPALVVAIALIGLLGPDTGNLIFSLCLTHWAEYARVARALVLAEREKTYVRYARFAGAGFFGTVFSYVLSNVVPRLLVLVFQNIGEILLTVAGLSLIGIGVPMPYPEWGTMLMGARDYLQTAPQLMIYPGAAIFITILLFNFIGDILRDVMDPAGGDAAENN